MKADSDGLLRLEGRTYEFVLASGDDYMSLELYDVTEEEPFTLLIGRRLDDGRFDFLSLENRGEPAEAPRFLSLDLVEYFLRQLRTI